MTTLYILKCNDNSYYIGITQDLEKRIYEHNSGQVHYTGSRISIELVFKKKYFNSELAARAEKKLKSWSRFKKEKIIDGEWELIL